MSTLVTYGKVKLVNALTREFTQVAVRDESNTDTWYYKFTCRWTSLVNVVEFNAANQPFIGAWPTGSYQPGIGTRGGGNVANAADALAFLNTNLCIDRQQFSLQMDGFNGQNQAATITLLASDPPNIKNSKYPDVNNGPKVIELSATLVSPQTIVVQFGLEICLSGCSSNPAVLGNRWSEIDDYDESYRCTRVYRGKLRMATVNTQVGDFRKIVLPPLIANFKRKRMHFETAQNGLELGYEIQDQEMLGAAPPSPATRMHGTHTESFGPDAVKANGTLNIRLDGPSTASKSDLLQRCMDIAFRKIQLPGFNPVNGGGNTTMLSMVVGNHFSDDENAIEVAIEYLRAGQTGQLLAGAGQLATIVQPMSGLGIPKYDVAKAVTFDAFGTAGTVGIVAAILQSPCSDHKFPGIIDPVTTPATGGQSGTTSPSTEGPTTTTYSVTDTLSRAFSAPPYSSEQTGGSSQPSQAYSFSQVDLRREKTYNRLMLPIAASTGSQANNSQDSAVVITLGPPTCKLHVKIAMERYNKPPDLLKDVDFNGSDGIIYRILDFVPELRPPKPLGNGRDILYSADADYVWAMNRAPSPGATLSMASLPWTTTTIAKDAGSQTYNAPTDQTKGIV